MKIVAPANDNIQTSNAPCPSWEGQDGRRRTVRASDLKRALKALRSVGMDALRIEIEPHGNIAIILTSTSADSQKGSLDNWLSTHARSA